MVDSKIQDLIDSAKKDAAMFRLSGAPARSRSRFSGRLTRNVLSAAELKAGAEANLIDKDFLNNLTLRDKDIPDALKTNRFGTPAYNPESQFTMAFEAMGLSLNSSITSVLDAIRVHAPQIQQYGPVVGATGGLNGWRTRRDLSVDAFREIMMTVEVANIDTNSAYITFKGQMQSIAAQLKPLEGLPSNITPQIKAMYTLATQFENSAQSIDFKQLFTLKPRLTDGTATEMPRDAGALGIGGGAINPIALMRPLVTAKTNTPALRTHYYTLWITMLDCYNLALEAIMLYDKINFELVTTTRTGIYGFRRTSSTSAFPTLLATRDTLRNELVASLTDPPAKGLVAANAISTPLPPTGANTGAEIEEQLAYTKQFVIDMKAFLVTL
jgi:hypothetical protein